MLRTRQAPLSNPAAVAALAAQLIPDDAREHFGVLMLDAQNRLVVYHEVSTGTLSASLVHPREVFGSALRVMGVPSIILILFDLPIHDHVILGNGTSEYVSLASRGLI